MTSKPAKTPAERKADTDEAWRMITSLVRSIRRGKIAFSPVDQYAPTGTQIRRIKAYNTLQLLARPGHDMFCGKTSVLHPNPCVLKRGHEAATYEDDNPHMDAEQRDRALRYLMLRSAPKPPAEA